jgi:hypothetical protein
MGSPARMACSLMIAKHGIPISNVSFTPRRISKSDIVIDNKRMLPSNLQNCGGWKKCMHYLGCKWRIRCQLNREARKLKFYYRTDLNLTKPQTSLFHQFGDMQPHLTCITGLFIRKPYIWIENTKSGAVLLLSTRIILLDSSRIKPTASLQSTLSTV